MIECNAEDCVSRELLQNILCCFRASINKDAFEHLWERIKSMPSVYPKSDKTSGKWTHEHEGLMDEAWVCSRPPSSGWHPILLFL